jgi:hypothetical protein
MMMEFFFAEGERIARAVFCMKTRISSVANEVAQTANAGVAQHSDDDESIGTSLGWRQRQR